MIRSMILCRTCFLSKITSKLGETSASKYRMVQLHTSSYLARRKAFRRRTFEVYLPQDDTQNPTEDATKPPRTSPVNIVGTSPSDTTFMKKKQSPEQQSSFPVNVKQDELDRIYTKVPSDKRFGNAMVLAKNRKQRERSNQVVLEGYRLVRDALLAGARCHILFFSMVSHLEGLPIDKKETELVKIPYKEFEFCSDLATPQGIVGVFNKPTHQSVHRDDTDPCLPLTLVCDNIRDPGNLGTILRAAAAANCEKILVTKGCVDIWDPKVLRAGAGAHFHTPINNRVTWSDVSNYIDSDVSLHIADGNRDSKRTTSAGDSLLQIAYSEVDWSSQSALVIGGETEGISEDATELCGRTHGASVYIPMSQGVDSLNAAMSTAVLLFEAKRQWLLYRQNLKTS